MYSIRLPTDVFRPDYVRMYSVTTNYSMNHDSMIHMSSEPHVAYLNEGYTQYFYLLNVSIALRGTNDSGSYAQIFSCQCSFSTL